MAVAKHVDFTSYEATPNVASAKESIRATAPQQQLAPCLHTPPRQKGRAPTKWYKPPAPCPLAKSLGIGAPDAVRLLHTARLSYAQGDDWVGQRYLFAALVMQCPVNARPDATRLTQAEETLKRLL